MISIHFKQELPKIILFVFACMLPWAAIGTTDMGISEKRNEVAMRMIGHDVLMSLGDCESRIMPIEKIDGHYKIPFESEFGIDPGELVSIVDRVMSENSIASDYVVEVEQCESGEIVHSFAMGNVADPAMIPCIGRFLPEDCYNLLVTIYEGTQQVANLQTMTSDGLSLEVSKASQSYFFRAVLLTILTLSLVGIIAYVRKKMNPRLMHGQAAGANSHVITIGAFLFDKRNLALSIENEKVELSYKEAELLSVLHTSANAPLEREVILRRVWGDDGDYVGRTLDVFISKLRKKLQADASLKIVNIRGVGYKLMMDMVK